MGQFRKKPVVIEATQWFKNGDHPDDGEDVPQRIPPSRPFIVGEGRVVRYYRGHFGGRYCKRCEVNNGRHTMNSHGWIDTLEGGHTVCPGDWIITGVQGERYPCKPDIFEETYEYANAEDDPNEDVEPATGVMIQGKGVDSGSAHELILEVTVNGHVGTSHIGPLFFEAIREHWDREAREHFGMTYEECLIRDQANFDRGLKARDPDEYTKKDHP